MKMHKVAVALMLATMACVTIAPAHADDSTDQARARLAAAQKKLDDLRDNATAEDYRTVHVTGADGHAMFRRIPTEEFAQRIERAEKERDAAQADLKHPKRSL